MERHKFYYRRRVVQPVRVVSAARLGDQIDPTAERAVTLGDDASPKAAA